MGKVGVYRYDGTSWSKQALPWHKGYIGWLYSVWGTNGNRAFAGGLHTMLRWDGQAWTLMEKPPGSFSYDSYYINGLWGSGSTLFVAGSEWNGPAALWRATCTP